MTAHKRGHHRASFSATRADAMASPGLWCLVSTYRSGGQSATRAARAIRNGFHGFTPTGAFESRVEPLGDETALYVCFTGTPDHTGVPSTERTRLTDQLHTAIAAFQRTNQLPGLQHAQIRFHLAEHLATQLLAPAGPLAGVRGLRARITELEQELLAAHEQLDALGNTQPRPVEDDPVRFVLTEQTEACGRPARNPHQENH